MLTCARRGGAFTGKFWLTPDWRNISPIFLLFSIFSDLFLIQTFWRLFLEVCDILIFEARPCCWQGTWLRWADRHYTQIKLIISPNSGFNPSQGLSQTKRRWNLFGLTNYYLSLNSFSSVDWNYIFISIPTHSLQCSETRRQLTVELSKNLSKVQLRFHY